MKRFKYKAKNIKGEYVKGEVEATNQAQALKLLRNRDLVVISLNEKRELSIDVFSKVKNRVTPNDVANFTRQFSTMVNSGLPLTESLLVLRTQSSGSMERIVSQILADVEEGQALSKAMGRFPQVFSKTYIALIQAGETGGVLSEVLLRLSENLEKQQEFRGKVRGALIYPIVIVIGMILVTIVMLVFVLPRLTTLYDQFDADLPVTTTLIIGMSNVLINFWPIVLAVIFILLFLLNRYKQTDAGARQIDDLLLKIPLVGPLKKQVILAELSRTLSLLVGSGVSILESLSVSSGVVENRVISDALKDASAMVEKGFPVAMSFSKHPEAFPFIFSQMIAVGEETGKMDEVLMKVSHVFEVESDQKVKALTSAIEPIILIILGVGVAFLVVSIIMPIYNLTSQI